MERTLHCSVTLQSYTAVLYCSNPQHTLHAPLHTAAHCSAKPGTTTHRCTWCAVCCCHAQQLSPRTSVVASTVTLVRAAIWTGWGLVLSHRDGWGCPEHSSSHTAITHKLRVYRVFFTAHHAPQSAANRHTPQHTKLSHPKARAVHHPTRHMPSHTPPPQPYDSHIAAHCRQLHSRSLPYPPKQHSAATDATRVRRTSHHTRRTPL